MRVYIRKIYPHDVTHEVSVTGDVVREFFSGHTAGMHFVGIKSGESGIVTINSATDPRFGGDFKRILSAEYPSYGKDDIIAIYDKRNNNYSMEVISKLDKRHATLFEMYKGLERHIITYADDDIEDKPDESEEASGGENVLVYGVPGSGKSFFINNIIKGKSNQRVVFHPDYTYSDFVGQVMPRVVNDENGKPKLTYEFVPGPFTKALIDANQKKRMMHYLIIEEINRGNAPAIFGDIFQLLDREEDGSSTYSITNFDIAREVYGNEYEKIRIPKNLSIYATMNTSDQNVFTLDTAFQRRWKMKFIKNDINEASHAGDTIVGTPITWRAFVEVINEKIMDGNANFSSTEDKQIGAFFINEKELKDKDIFPEKALKYLWDDAFKLNRDDVFNQNIKSFGDVIAEFENNINNNNALKAVIREDLYDDMRSKSI